MKLRPLPIAFAAAAALLALGAALYWKSTSTPPPPAPAPVVPKLPANAAPNSVALERDHTAVFQRAFWRRPAADDRILHAERRDSLDGSSGVEKWQWFIAVQPSPAFREWFFKDNPFELVPVAPDAPAPELASPPAWFPPAAELTRLARHRNREGRYLVFHDLANNRLYATDAGGGFAASRK